MIGIVNYGSGNFTSVYNALSSITNEIVTINKVDDFDRCTHIILPGVGAFKAAMDKLSDLNLIEPLQNNVFQLRKPFLGICVGMQILAETGFEFEETKGLGWIKGNVVKFDEDKLKSASLPHIGWNEIYNYNESPLFENIRVDDPSFYFVHSYHLESSEANVQCTYSSYGYPFIAAIQKENIFGVQFHPEKSQFNGIQVLKNFLKFNG